jgi:hypothetical protein
MSDNYRYPQAGRLVDASVGFTRGKIIVEYGKTWKILVQKFIPGQTANDPGEWYDTDKTIVAQSALPLTIRLPVNKIVWCMYIQQTYFIFLATCD